MYEKIYRTAVVVLFFVIFVLTMVNIAKGGDGKEELEYVSCVTLEFESVELTKYLTTLKGINAELPKAEEGQEPKYGTENGYLRNTHPENNVVFATVPSTDYGSIIALAADPDHAEDVYLIIMYDMKPSPDGSKIESAEMCDVHIITPKDAVIIQAYGKKK